jgi:hypothetical protein
MRSIIARGRTGPDGVLHLSVPVGTPDQDYEVLLNLHPHMTDIDWQKYIDETAGSITDESFFPEHCEPAAPDATASDWPPGFFEETAGAWQGELERAPQGEYEKREEL